MKLGKHVILSLKLNDEPGALSRILDCVAAKNANILAINQEVPIHNIAFVTLTIAITQMDLSVQAFIAELKTVKNVVDIMLIAVE